MAVGGGWGLLQPLDPFPSGHHASHPLPTGRQSFAFAFTTDRHAVLRVLALRVPDGLVDAEDEAGVGGEAWG